MKKVAMAMAGACLVLLATRPVAAQQRPLATQDPETIGSGRALVEAGVDVAHDVFYPLSGLKGNQVSAPVLGINVGLSSIADLQITGAPYQVLSIGERKGGPLAGEMQVTGDSTHSVRDIEIGMKIRLAKETESRPSFGFRFSTRLPNANHQSGMGANTTDFGASILAAKTIESVRVVGNVGVTIVSEPLNAGLQNDMLTYGVSFARALTKEGELVGEINGRSSTRTGEAPIGTESRSLLKLGARYTVGPVRADAGVFFGLTASDPTIGFTAGFTWVFNAFTLP